MRHFQSIILALLLLATCTRAFAQDEKSETPYLIAHYSNVSSSEPFQLNALKSHADIVVSGVIAEVVLKQQFANETDQTMEVEYVFPAGVATAVYGMQMIIGERIIKAEIKEKEQAQKEYDKALADGKKASLLQQHRPNVFQMNVANIQPGEKIDITLQYTEILVPTENIYELVLPITVGERYENATKSDKEKWVTNPFTTSRKRPSQTPFSVNCRVQSAIPISSIKCISHSVEPQFMDERNVAVVLDEIQGMRGNDFVLQYRLDGNKMETGMLLWEGEKENFFLYMSQAPRLAPAKTIPHREYIFIVDVSGSMNGYPLEVSKKMMKELLNGMNSNDRFNILLFASTDAVWKSEPQTATEDNIREALSFIKDQAAQGGTELLSALRKALGMKQKSGYSTSFVILTDGYVTVEKQAFELVKNNMDECNFFAFGIGESVNRYLIEGLARAGNSEPFIALNEKDAEEKAKRFKKYIDRPVLTDVSLQFNGFEAYDCIPEKPGDLFAEKPIVVFGKYRNDRSGTIQLNGRQGDGICNENFSVSEGKFSDANSAISYLWARHKVAELSDYASLNETDSLRAAIVDLGLNYNLLTKYTSFIAVEPDKTTEVELPTGNVNSNQSQSSPGSVPEPHEWFFILVISLILGYQIYKRFW